MKLSKTLEFLTGLCPLAQIAGAAALVWKFGSWGLGPALVWIFVMPPALWRFLRIFFPLKEGFSPIGLSQPANGWTVSYNLQLLFGTWPWLEKSLLFVPGAYSAWLRLWGARIGRNVVWTPGVEIADRPLVEIGDWAVLGHHTYLSSHVILREENKTVLWIRPIEIGSRAFIGAFSILGAGTRLRERETLEAGTVVIGKSRKKRYDDVQQL